LSAEERMSDQTKKRRADILFKKHGQDEAAKAREKQEQMAGQEMLIHEKNVKRAYESKMREFTLKIGEINDDLGKGGMVVRMEQVAPSSEEDHLPGAHITLKIDGKDRGFFSLRFDHEGNVRSSVPTKHLPSSQTINITSLTADMFDEIVMDLIDEALDKQPDRE
jgi:hypothetical protein